jgi:hypothetical protein
MKATKRLAYVLAGLVLLTSWAHQERASAEDVQVTGPLAGAPAVRHMRVFREGRLHCSRQFNHTVNIGVAFYLPTSATKNTRQHCPQALERIVAQHGLSDHELAIERE